MAWRVKMYMDTGFNSINVPDSENTLNTAAASTKEFDVIDCLQKYFLTTITIRGFEKDVIEGDYLKLYNRGPQGTDDKNYAFYIINGYTMTSGDTIELNVVMDPLLTCGGVQAIDFMDGIVTRRNFNPSMSNDESIEDDPLLIPRNLDLIYIGEYYGDSVTDFQEGEPGTIEFKPGASCDLIVGSTWPIMQKDHVEIESAVDVEVTEDSWTGTIDSKPKIKADQYTSQDSTKIDQNYGNSSGGTTQNKFYTVDGNVYYRFDSSTTSSVKDTAYRRLIMNCKDLISLGRQDALSAAYFVPHCLCVEGESIITHNEPGPAPAVAVLDRIRIVKGVPMKSFKEGLSNDSFFAYGDNSHLLGRMSLRDYYEEKNNYHVKNNRAIMGDNTMFTFVVRDTGDRAEVSQTDLKYELYKPTSQMSEMIIPAITVTVDLRPSGHVEYGIPNDSPGSGSDWFNPAPVTLKSGNWEQANLTVSATDNLYLNMQKYDLSQAQAEDKVVREADFEVNSKSFGIVNHINPVSNLQQWVQGKYRSKAESGYGSSKLGAGLPAQYRELAESQIAMSEGNEYAKALYQRANDRIAERQEFINSSYEQPHVLSKGGGNTLTSSHGLMLFRTVPSIDDVKRFDRILNQFGTKVTEAMKPLFMKDRPLFNYVEASGVSIRLANNSTAIRVPKSVRDDLAQLFAGGLRIWHTDPKQHTYDEDN